MREILFRGKSRDTDRWVFGDFVSDACGISHEGCLNEYGEVGYIMTYVIPETVGQFTGLTDKNGKKIFEGDIVDILTENEEIGIVVYDEGGFLVKADGFCVDFHTNINGADLEIIGNTQDSPKPFKGGADNV